jgi:hypothetical protein
MSAQRTSQPVSTGVVGGTAHPQSGGFDAVVVLLAPSWRTPPVYSVDRKPGPLLQPCTMREPNAIKTKPALTNDRPIRPLVAVVLGVGLLIVVAFQTALTSGAPFGVAAQGGTNPGSSRPPFGS